MAETAKTSEAYAACRSGEKKSEQEKERINSLNIFSGLLEQLKKIGISEIVPVQEGDTLLTITQCLRPGQINLDSPVKYQSTKLKEKIKELSKKKTTKERKRIIRQTNSNTRKNR